MYPSNMARMLNKDLALFSSTPKSSAKVKEKLC